MSLFDDALEPCFIMDKTTAKDGYGGVITTYVEGAEIEAAIVYGDTLQNLVAAVKEGKDSYTIITRRNVVLQFGDVIKRVSDNGMFTITSNGKDRATPPGAGLDMRAVKAVEFTG